MCARETAMPAFNFGGSNGSSSSSIENDDTLTTTATHSTINTLEQRPLLSINNNNNNNNHHHHQQQQESHKRRFGKEEDDDDENNHLTLLNPINRQMRHLYRNQHKIFRLVNRSHKQNGHFNMVKHHIPLSQRLFAVRDTYHALLNIRWYKLFALCFLFYCMIHLAFGFLYFLGGKEGLENTDKHSYWNCVFFSVQTFSTIGYGKIYPSSGYTNMIVSIESFVAIFAESFVISLVIGKFTRPSLLKRQIVFSNVAVINQLDYEGNVDHSCRYLRFRFVNMQKSQFVDAHFRLLLLKWEYEEEKKNRKSGGTTGKNSRRHEEEEEGGGQHSISITKKSTGPQLLKPTIYELDFQINIQRGLARGIDHASPLLPLPWTVVHKIDENSPLCDMIDDRNSFKNVEIVAIYDAIDEATSHNIQSRFSYTKKEIFKNATFKGCVFREKKQFSVDMQLFEEIEPCDYTSGSGGSNDHH